jgi:hypothetical protein
MVGTTKEVKMKKLVEKQNEESPPEITEKGVRFDCGECDEMFDSSPTLESHLIEGENLF